MRQDPGQAADLGKRRRDSGNAARLPIDILWYRQCRHRTSPRVDSSNYLDLFVTVLVTAKSEYHDITLTA